MYLISNRLRIRFVSSRRMPAKKNSRTASSGQKYAPQPKRGNVRQGASDQRVTCALFRIATETPFQIWRHMAGVSVKLYIMTPENTRKVVKMYKLFECLV